MRRALGLGLDLLRAQAGRPLPFKLTFLSTDVCSCRCAVCLLWQAPRPGVDAAEIDRLFAANPHLSWINLSGGDVVERDDFVAIVRSALARTRVYLLDFPTAGQQPARVEAHVEAALRAGTPRLYVSVSVDGPPEVHDRLRGTPGAFARAAETLERLLRLERSFGKRLRAFAGLTFSSRNDADPAALYASVLRALPALPRSRLHLNLAHHAPHHYRNRAGDIPDRARLAEFLAGVRASRRGLAPVDFVERAWAGLAVRYLEAGVTPLPCRALRSSAFVDPELRLYPCASWDHPLVDLREVGYSLRAALALQQSRAARRAARALACPNCWTPCEALPTMLSQWPRAVWRARAKRPRPSPAAPPAPSVPPPPAEPART